MKISNSVNLPFLSNNLSHQSHALQFVNVVKEKKIRKEF